MRFLYTRRARRQLLYLARRANETVARHELWRAVFGLRVDPGTNALAVQVSRLRASLDRGFGWSMLLAERGGYRLVVQPNPFDGAYEKRLPGLVPEDPTTS